MSVPEFPARGQGCFDNLIMVVSGCHRRGTRCRGTRHGPTRSHHQEPGVLGGKACIRGMRVTVDMNLSPRWIGLLTKAGFEAAHWSTLGAANASDTEIMKYASTND